MLHFIDVSADIFIIYETISNMKYLSSLWSDLWIFLLCPVEFHIIVCGLDSIIARRWINGMLVSSDK